MNRRSFLKGVFTVSAVAVVPMCPSYAAIPILHGDGVSDDTAAIQAMVNGLPVMVEGEVVHCIGMDLAYLRGGRFLVTDTIHVPLNGHLRISDCTVILTHFPVGAPVFWMH